MGRIIVREAMPEDAGLLASFNRRMALETERKELDPERALRGARGVFEVTARGTYYVADEGGRAVGACLVTREWSDWRDAEYWWLQSVFVVPEMRGRGVFRALYGDVLERARCEGACGLRLYVEHENARAQAVYRAVGMSASHYRFFELDLELARPAPGGTGRDGRADRDGRPG